MPALFQYAILFLAGLLCVSLVLCVRESTDADEKGKAAPRPSDPLQSRTQPGPERVGSLRAPPPPLSPEPTSSLLRSESAIPRAPREMPPREPKSFVPFADEANRALAPSPASSADASLDRSSVPPRLSGSAAAPGLKPGSAMDVEPRLPPRPLDTTADAPSDFADRDTALDQRNDTLWDLVVHLRDYVEQLRSERLTLHEEAQMLRNALAEATEEVRALRASQLAANCNEQTSTAADDRAADPDRLETGPKRLH